jgi:hypothetical protein
MFSTSIATTYLPVFAANQVKGGRFQRVAGFAATKTMPGYQSWDPANRRLSVLIVFPMKYLEVTGDGTDNIGDLGGLTPQKNKGGETSEGGGQHAEPTGDMAQPAADQYGN